MLLIVAYGLGLLFSLKTHREFFASSEHVETDTKEALWPMDLQFWPGAVVMVLIATMTASLVTNSGRSTWFVGVLALMVTLISAITLYELPPRVQS